MRARTLILLLVAVVLAGGTAMLARAWLKAQKSHAVAEAAPVALPPPVKSVLVAHHPLARGEILKASDLAWEPWPDNGVDPSYIRLGTRTPQSFSGWVARFPIGSGQPVTLANVVAPGSRGFLAALLLPGMRAVSVELNATTGISGFVAPGDRVDILITYPVPNIAPASAGMTEVHHKASETILRNIRVLGIDQQLQTKKGEAVLAKTATLEVTPKQSEVLALASEMGKLSLSLRSLADSPTPVAEASATATDGAPIVTKVSATTATDDESPVSDSAAPDGAASYTLDSQVSLFMPEVTVLRGNTK